MELDIETELKLDLAAAQKRKKKRPAAISSRLVAFIIDAVVLLVAIYPITIVLNLVLAALSIDVKNMNQGADLKTIIAVYAVMVLTQIILPIIYSGYFLSKKGATPGKMVMGIKVIDIKSRKKVSFWQGAFRENFGKLVSTMTFFIGFIMAAFRKDKKALHDILFSTQVVSAKVKKKKKNKK